MGIDSIYKEMDRMEEKKNSWLQPIGKNKERADIACEQLRISGKSKEGAYKIVTKIYSLIEVSFFFKEGQYEMSEGGGYEDYKDH